MICNQSFTYMLFSTIAHDTHIIGIPSIVSLTFEYIETQLQIIGLFSNLTNVLHGPYLV